MSTKAVDKKNKTLFQNDTFQGHHKNGIIIKSHCKYFLMSVQNQNTKAVYFLKSQDLTNLRWFVLLGVGLQKRLQLQL